MAESYYPETAITLGKDCDVHLYKRMWNTHLNKGNSLAKHYVAFYNQGTIEDLEEQIGAKNSRLEEEEVEGDEVEDTGPSDPEEFYSDSWLKIRDIVLNMIEHVFPNDEIIQSVDSEGQCLFYGKTFFLTAEAEDEGARVATHVYLTKVYHDKVPEIDNIDWPPLPEGYSYESADIKVERKEDRFPINQASIANDGRLNINTFMLKSPSIFDYLDTNYSDEAVEISKELLEIADHEERKGSIVLLHGPVGTGKTYWIKGMSKEFSDKEYDIVLVDNPFRFLSAGGYSSVISHMDNDCLFIFEDAGDLFTEESKERAGDVFSSLANITDGIVSSARRDIFLFSFNYDIGMIEKAYTRPGRCLADFNIEDLSVKKANALLKSKGVKKRVKEPTSLAILYDMGRKAKKLKLTEKPEKRKVGFGS